MMRLDFQRHSIRFNVTAPRMMRKPGRSARVAPIHITLQCDRTTNDAETTFSGSHTLDVTLLQCDRTTNDAET